MIDFKVHINGYEELEKFFKEEPGRIKNRIGEGLGEIGKIMVKTASDFAPYDTGLLSRSIEFKVGKNRDNQFVTVYVPMDSEAGKYAYRMNESNYTVRHMRPGAGRLFMDRALAKETPKVVSVIDAQLEKTVKGW